MANMFDYLNWRGDILFSEMPPNPVDALILSTLAYVHYDGAVPHTLTGRVTMQQAAEAVLAMPDLEKRCRIKSDLDLLRAAAATARFGKSELCFYRDILIPEEDTQFAAIAFLLEDGSAFLSFRGTDNTLVGWKEDFNMTFQDSIPAQRLAEQYTREFAAGNSAFLRLGGHSKGGNLAVYAAAKCGPEIQERITEVYNHDGPGFREQMIADPGYLAIVPKIRTFVPQSSVFGMLLEHKEPYIVIKSKHIGIMQHDPYTWEVMGGNFIIMEQRTQDSYFMDRTFDAWLASMTLEERNAFFDAFFEILAQGDTNRPMDIIRPQNLRAYFKTLHMDETKRRIISSELLNLIQSAISAQRMQEDDQEE